MEANVPLHELTKIADLLHTVAGVAGEEAPTDRVCRHAPQSAVPQAHDGCVPDLLETLLRVVVSEVNRVLERADLLR